MKNDLISESTYFPFVKLRNQPYRIYKRFEGRQEIYKKCEKKYEHFGSRYYRIRYRSLDGAFVEGLVVVPKGFSQNKKYQTLVFNHGNWEEGRRFTFCFTGIYEFWARNNFVVFAPQYRGVHGGEGKDEWGGSDVNDVVQIFNIAKSLPFVDSENVFMMGNSRGGMMSLLAMKYGIKPRGTILNCATVDATEFGDGDDVLAHVYPDISPQKKMDEYKKRSATNWPEKINSPLLLIHGALDKGVPVSGVKKLSKKLQKLKKDHKLIIYPKAGHCGENYPKSFHRDILDWISRKTITIEK